MDSHTLKNVGDPLPPATTNLAAKAKRYVPSTLPVTANSEQTAEINIPPDAALPQKERVRRIREKGKVENLHPPRRPLPPQFPYCLAVSLQRHRVV